LHELNDLLGNRPEDQRMLAGDAVRGDYSHGTFQLHRSESVRLRKHLDLKTLFAILYACEGERVNGQIATIGKFWTTIRCRRKAENEAHRIPSVPVQ
jgi:hypothetical protein